MVVALVSVTAIAALVDRPRLSCVALTWRQRIARGLVPPKYSVPDFVRGLSIPKQLGILRVDNAFVHQEAEIDRATPERLADKHNRDRFDLPGLDQSASRTARPSCRSHREKRSGRARFTRCSLRTAK